MDMRQELENIWEGRERQEPNNSSILVTAVKAKNRNAAVHHGSSEVLSLDKEKKAESHV